MAAVFQKYRTYIGTDSIRHLTNSIRRLEAHVSISDVKRSVLGRIDADVCDEIRGGKLLTRSR